MSNTRITIRGLDPELYRRLRVVAVREKIPAGKLLNLAIIKFLRENESERQGSQEEKPMDRISAALLEKLKQTPPVVPASERHFSQNDKARIVASLRGDGWDGEEIWRRSGLTVDDF
jgi:hypothetical protein